MSRAVLEEQEGGGEPDNSSSGELQARSTDDSPVQDAPPPSSSVTFAPAHGARRRRSSGSVVSSRDTGRNLTVSTLDNAPPAARLRDDTHCPLSSAPESTSRAGAAAATISSDGDDPPSPTQQRRELRASQVRRRHAEQESNYCLSFGFYLILSAAVLAVSSMYMVYLLEPPETMTRRRCLQCFTEGAEAGVKNIFEEPEAGGGGGGGGSRDETDNEERSGVCVRNVTFLPNRSFLVREHRTSDNNSNSRSSSKTRMLRNLTDVMVVARQYCGEASCYKSEFLPGVVPMPWQIVFLGCVIGVLACVVIQAFKVFIFRQVVLREMFGLVDKKVDDTAMLAWEVENATDFYTPRYGFGAISNARAQRVLQVVEVFASVDPVVFVLVFWMFTVVNFVSLLLEFSQGESELFSSSFLGSSAAASFSHWQRFLAFNSLFLNNSGAAPVCAFALSQQLAQMCATFYMNEYGRVANTGEPGTVLRKALDSVVVPYSRLFHRAESHRMHLLGVCVLQALPLLPAFFVLVVPGIAVFLPISFLLFAVFLLNRFLIVKAKSVFVSTSVSIAVILMLRILFSFVLVLVFGGLGNAITLFYNGAVWDKAMLHGFFGHDRGLSCYALALRNGGRMSTLYEMLLASLATAP